MKNLAFMGLLFSSLFAREEVPKLTLTASANLAKPADELRLKLGVVNQGETAREALYENSIKMQEAMYGLSQIGLVSDDYETDQFSINPIYSTRPKNAPSDWKAEIISYEVRNQIQIHTEKLELAGEIIDLATKSGANSVSDIHFSLKNPDEYRVEALTLASQNAERDAKAILEPLRSKTVRVLSVHLNQTQIRSYQPKMAMCVEAGSFAPPIESGDVSLSANVTVTYEITTDL